MYNLYLYFEKYRASNLGLAIKFVFRNDNFLDFIFIRTTWENKVVEKFDLQKR